MAHGLGRQKMYSATIDRISESGNGIVQIDSGGHVNLGTMSESKVDKVVTFVYKGKTNGDFLEMGEGEEATPIEDVEFDKENSTSSSSSSGSSSSGSSVFSTSGYMSTRNNSERRTSIDNPVREQAGSKNNLLNGNQ